jgi:hypothetical protein
MLIKTNIKLNSLIFTKLHLDFHATANYFTGRRLIQKREQVYGVGNAHLDRKLLVHWIRAVGGQTRTCGTPFSRVGPVV